MQDALAYVRSDTSIVVEINDDLLVYVDRQRFEQILVNLVGNALRYGRPPLVVRLSRDGDTDRLEVRDHGPGIPDSLRDNLFGQFAVGGPEGVGLGLWIVRQLAAAHGGQATAEPRTPGVAMVITFPAPETAAPETPPPETPPPETATAAPEAAARKAPAPQPSAPQARARQAPR